jgi:hypothetical protein
MTTTQIPMIKLPKRKRSQLHKSAYQPPMYITIEGHEYDPLQQAIVYIIEVGIQHETMVEIHHQKVRYSELENFHKAVGNKINNGSPFPGKKYFGNFDEQFILERKVALQNYLAHLNLNPDLIHSFVILIENQI